MGVSSMNRVINSGLIATLPCDSNCQTRKRLSLLPAKTQRHRESPRPRSTSGRLAHRVESLAGLGVPKLYGWSSDPLINSFPLGEKANERIATVCP